MDSSGGGAGACVAGSGNTAASAVQTGSTAAAGVLVTPDHTTREQRPPVQVEPPSGSVSAGRARWTVPAAEFNWESCRFDPTMFAKLVSKTGREITLDACTSSVAHALAASWCT